MLNSLLQQLDNSTTLLTPNRRLSATLLKKYNQLNINAGKSCWASADILPLTSWVQRLFQEYSAKTMTAAPFLLTSQQESILWEEILQKFPANEALLQLSETAELAKSAWGILKQWRIDITHPSLNTMEDSHAFLLWATEFKTLCEKNNWLDTNSLISIICEKILEKKLTLPNRLIAIGFTEYSPLQKHLFACCEKIGTHVIYEIENQNTMPIAKRISLTDEETEIRTMARWAKALLEKEATLNIGCIVPNLEKIRDHLFPIFSEVFSEGQLYPLDSTTQPFNITAGKSLSTYPIIHTALQLLSLSPHITAENMSYLLLSPFLGDAEHEHTQRAQFDARLRESNNVMIGLNKLIHSKEEKFSLDKHCPKLAKRLENFIALRAQHTDKLPISTWINIFMEALNLLGWPGERSINSQEYQVVQRWLELLNEYKTVNIFLPHKNYHTALHYLIKLTSNTVFQPQSKEAKIQILGVLEAAGLPFDHTWVMGFDDNAWPPPAKPNPFIPRQLQAIMQMPHSTAEHEFSYSQRLTQQLIQNTEHIIFSHAKNQADCELRASPLISHFPELNSEQLSLSKLISLAEKCRQSQKMEMIQDTLAPAVNAAHIHGGASLFKLQAACPFKAFAEIRLNAKPLESSFFGLKPQNRGKITHKAMELVWQEIKNSEKLHGYTDIELKNLLTSTVTEAIQLITGNEISTSHYLSLEAKRLQNLLWDWLQVEKSRPPFNVLAQEKELSITIANLPIKLRIDRIDELKNGDHVIIDYKTGKNSHIKYWFGDRLDEPQLPLYAILSPTTVTSIAFADIHPDALTFKGISKYSLDIDMVKPLSETHYHENRSWEQQILAWKQTLEKLGNDFSQGYAEVDPKTEIETCTHCHLQALCRV